MSVKLPVKICNQVMMRRRLERFGEVEVEIVDDTNVFGLDTVKKTGSRFRSTIPDVETRYLETDKNFL